MIMLKKSIKIFLKKVIKVLDISFKSDIIVLSNKTNEQMEVSVMAWYYGKYSCGCDGRVNICAPTKDRQRIADWKFEGLCPECYKKQQEEERAKANKEAAEKSAEMALPELIGTVKQVAWATTIRLDKINIVSSQADKLIEKIQKSPNHEDKKPAGIAMVKNTLNWFIGQHTDAVYWIDNRDAVFNINIIMGDYTKTAEGAAAMTAMTAGVTVKTEPAKETPVRVAKKGYDKSAIMKRAWAIKKATDGTFSECLKKAWAEAKQGQ